MTGPEFLASFITTGHLWGIGIGSTLGEVDRVLHHPFVDDLGEGNAWLRRDYGLLELSFNPGPRWVLSNLTIQLHRLAPNPGTAREWAPDVGAELPCYQPWEELRHVLSRTPGVPELKASTQGGFREYRAEASHVSVLVVDAEDEERGYRVGHGDVWSLDLWAPIRAL